jgi:septal ring factor EnvC (AmiA/AmiB activator)
MKKIKPIQNKLFLRMLTATCAMLILFSSMPAYSQKNRAVAAHVDAKKIKELDKQYEQLQNYLKELDQQKAQLQGQLKSYSEKLNEVVKNVQSLEKEYDSINGTSGAVAGSATSGSSADLMQATQQMQETQMSFNLQYLGLQNNMQNENRQFTMVSNIMKTKHDTEKNVISNIR